MEAEAEAVQQVREALVEPEEMALQVIPEQAEAAQAA